MAVKVKILERDFVTGAASIYYKMFSEADTFDILMNQTQEQTHLRIVQENQQVAFFPSGGWLGVEIIKEK